MIFEGFPPHSSFNSLFFKVKLYNTSYWSNHVRATRLVLHCVVFLAPEKKQDLGKIEVTDLVWVQFFQKMKRSLRLRGTQNLSYFVQAADV